MNKAYISRVKIKNYRNFLNVDFSICEKQLVLGENAVGKSNYIRALRLILDQSFSDFDRTLTVADFNDSLIDPMKNGETIEISIYISNFENNDALLSVLSDAKIEEDGIIAAKITYVFEPRDKEDFSKGYLFIIYKGADRQNRFDSSCRRYLNIRVINALRNAVDDFSSFKTSPVFSIIKKYSISESNAQLNNILEEIKTTSEKIFEVDELADARRYIKDAVNPVLERYSGSAIDIDLLGNKVSKIIGQLRILENGGFLSESSFGITNIIYILLTLAASSTPPIPTFINAEKYIRLKQLHREIIDSYYLKTANSNYILNQEKILTDSDRTMIYKLALCIDDNIGVNTIIAIEEPEAHLHPAFIRMIYKDIFEEESPVIFTSHSPEIASVCPLRYYVDIKKDQLNQNTSKIISGLSICEVISQGEIKRLERYIDTNRADIFFGRKVILVEGICEKMIIPKFASLQGAELDSNGIIVCNVSSTNFLPYCKLLRYFGIPYVIITDGDPDNEYTGTARMIDILKGLYGEAALTSIADWTSFFIANGIFIGKSTLEIDILESFHRTENQIIIDSALNVTTGGEVHKSNFRDNYAASNFADCYRTIESNYIGKANFIQELSSAAFGADSVPKYISEAIEFISR